MYYDEVKKRRDIGKSIRCAVWGQCATWAELEVTPSYTWPPEQRFCAVLGSILVIPFVKSQFPWMLGLRGGPLELDFYNAQYQLAFEYQPTE